MKSFRTTSVKILSVMFFWMAIAVGVAGAGDFFPIPGEPGGPEYEQTVPIPDVSYPLPAVEHAPNNSSSVTKYSIDTNPMAYALRGINNIWQGTTDYWQKNASSYSDEVNGYEGGDGPGPDDYVAGNPIVDEETWKTNIDYGAPRKFDGSCRVKVPARQELTIHLYRVLRLRRSSAWRSEQSRRSVHREACRP